jgi:hypothetical protein
MAGLGETLGSPWPPLAKHPWISGFLTGVSAIHDVKKNSENVAFNNHPFCQIFCYSVPTSNHLHVVFLPFGNCSSSLYTF